MTEANSEDFLKDLPVQAEEIGYKPDEMLACRKCSRANAPKRLRNLEFRDNYIFLTLFNTNEIEVINLEDLTLIVAGAIFQKAVESTEARKKGESKILNATETASDESLIDIYTKENPNGY